MNASVALFAIKWLIRDTFRQAWSAGIFWLMSGVSVLCILLCLSVTVEGDVPLLPDGSENPEALPRIYGVEASKAVAAIAANGASRALGIWSVQVHPGTEPKKPLPFYSIEYQQVTSAKRHNVPIAGGKLTLAFGAIPVELARDRTTAVRSIECVLAGWVADAAGLLLALVFTAGFLPSFLHPAAVAVLLTKPVPRWSLLVGKYLGVLTFVAVQIFIFLSGTWLALGVRTGVWDPTYFVCLPLLLLHFSVFFSFSAMLAVLTRSTVVCTFGSILFWLLCWGMNYGRHVALSAPDLQNESGLFSFATGMGYWLLPKPLDIHSILVSSLQADNLFSRVVDTQLLTQRDAWHPELSVLASLLTGLVLLGIAAYEFVNTDY